MSYLLRGSFIFIFALYGTCGAMSDGSDFGLKTRLVRVVYDQDERPVTIIDGKKVVVIRSASPSVNPKEFCDIVGRSVIYGTTQNHNEGHPISTPKRANEGLANQSIPQRSSTPWDLDFDETLIRVLGDQDLGNKWSSNLAQLMAKIVAAKTISALSVTAYTEGSIPTISSLIAPVVAGGVEKLGINYKNN